METKSYEKRRGRVKKKVEAVRAAMENIMNGSPSRDDFLDSPLGFPLSLFSFHPPKYQLTDRIVLADHMILQSLIQSPMELGT
jgi:hypothetical protein